jgi:hypothetical protein
MNAERSARPPQTCGAAVRYADWRLSSAWQEAAPSVAGGGAARERKLLDIQAKLNGQAIRSFLHIACPLKLDHYWLSASGAVMHSERSRFITSTVVAENRSRRKSVCSEFPHESRIRPGFFR